MEMPSSESIQTASIETNSSQNGISKKKAGSLSSLLCLFVTFSSSFLPSFFLSSSFFLLPLLPSSSFFLFFLLPFSFFFSFLFSLFSFPFSQHYHQPEKLEGEELIVALKKQLSYYFSRENLSTDSFLSNFPSL